MIIDASANNPEPLPDYDASMREQPPRPRPHHPVTYTFSPWESNSESNSMLLLPPADARDQRPLYRIVIRLDLNPFLPVSYVTSVYRGRALEDFVGGFSLSLNQRRGILHMGDTMTRLSNVLFPINSSSHHWSWVLDSVNLRWDCRSKLDDGSPMCICYAPDGNTTQLASFVPPPPDASPPLPSAQLTVFPSGHDYFDDVLVSALLVERKITSDY